MGERPPASFIADQISIAISNYMVELTHQSFQMSDKEFLQKSFPAGTNELISKAAANAVDLWNLNQKEEA